MLVWIFFVDFKNHSRFQRRTPEQGGRSQGTGRILGILTNLCKAAVTRVSEGGPKSWVPHTCLNGLSLAGGCCGPPLSHEAGTLVRTCSEGARGLLKHVEAMAQDNT
jgi:hypothetical protein